MKRRKTRPTKPVPVPWVKERLATIDKLVEQVRELERRIAADETRLLTEVVTKGIPDMSLEHAMLHRGPWECEDPRNELRLCVYDANAEIVDVDELDDEDYPGPGDEDCVFCGHPRERK